MSGDRSKIEAELQALEEAIAEVKLRMPAHSVKPQIMMELLNLEDERDALTLRLEEMKKAEKLRGQEPALSDCRHLEGEPIHTCEKYGISMCEVCLRCRDPEIYCRFRSACIVHFLTRRKGSSDRPSG